MKMATTVRLPVSAPNALIFGALLVCSLLTTSAAYGGELLKVRLGKHLKHTRLVFDLSAATTPKLIQNAADTYELHLPNTRWKASKLQARKGLVRKVSPTPHSAKSADLRLEIRLSGKVSASLQTLRSPSRVVLDLTEDVADDYVVVIDAGHGGKAPGAVGKAGTLEKNVTLAICKQLRTALNARPGIRAVMTRTGDQTLSLGQRVEIARDQQADLFVSVHADAITDRRVRGGTVYVLSNTGAEHAARRWAGASPTRSNTPQNLAGIDLSYRDADVANVLYDLVQTDTLQRSNLLAQDVLNTMLATERVRFQEVRLANLGVLKAPDVPSVLVETAFISNAEDEKLLASSKGQRSLARAIARGISSFIERPTELARARSGTLNRPLMATTAAYRDYAVMDGDTLYSLARRFGISVQELARTNRLKGNFIKQGMRLRVPGPAVSAGN